MLVTAALGGHGPVVCWDRAGSLAAFGEVIRTGAEASSSGRDHLGSLALMFAAIESAMTGRPQAIEALASSAGR